jgi:hypothetical protein
LVVIGRDVQKANMLILISMETAIAFVFPTVHLESSKIKIPANASVKRNVQRNLYKIHMIVPANASKLHVKEIYHLLLTNAAV